MGKGDKKTKKGKITMGSYGVLRPKKTAVKAVPTKEKAAKPVKTTKTKAKK